MVPNNEYAAEVAKNVAFEPPLPLFGVAGPTFTPISNFLIPAINGQSSVQDGVRKFVAELEKYEQQAQK